MSDAAGPRRTRVLVVEDSRTQRKAITRFLETRGEIELVGEAIDGQEGVEKAAALRPDVVLMDVRMPRLDGLEATRRIMGECPTPILLMTAPDNLTGEVNLGLEALSVGALDLLAKPDLAHLEQQGGEELVARLKLLAGVPVIAHPSGTKRSRELGSGSRRSTAYFRRAKRAVAVVASTGGPRALRVVLSGLPAGLKAAVVIVQHLDATFIEGLVEWLDEHCPLPVVLASDGSELHEGVVYVCPPGRYAELTDRRCVALLKEPVPRGGHCPSGDRLLKSLAANYGAHGVGVVLTGMGDDGAEGLLSLKDAGGTTLAQDEDTSVIYGMPREAARNGAAQRIVPLEDVAAAIVKAVGS